MSSFAESEEWAAEFADSTAFSFLPDPVKERIENTLRKRTKSRRIGRDYGHAWRPFEGLQTPGAFGKFNLADRGLLGAMLLGKSTLRGPSAFLTIRRHPRDASEDCL